MFDGLDDIPWDHLQTSYGPASPVPDLIRSLKLKDRKRHAEQLDTLGNLICHQASCSQATAPCVPFLLEVVRVKDTPNRERILSLLLTIAVGLDSDQLHYQTKMSDRLAEMEQKASELTERQRRELNWGPVLRLACYSAVRCGVPDFIHLLHDKSQSVRIQAAYNLAWFPADNRKSLPRLREQMRSARRTDELACSILSVGLLEFQASVARTSRSFVRPLIHDRRELIRYAAALYLFWHEPSGDVLALVRELSQNDEYDCYVGSKSLLFAGYAWNQYAERLIELYDGHETDNKAVNRSTHSRGN